MFSCQTQSPSNLIKLSKFSKDQKDGCACPISKYVKQPKLHGVTSEKMLESRPEDALEKLVKLVNCIDSGDFVDCGDSIESRDCGDYGRCGDSGDWRDCGDCIDCRDCID